MNSQVLLLLNRTWLKQRCLILQTAEFFDAVAALPQLLSSSVQDLDLRWADTWKKLGKILKRWTQWETFLNKTWKTNQRCIPVMILVTHPKLGARAQLFQACFQAQPGNLGLRSCSFRPNFLLLPCLLRSAFSEAKLSPMISTPNQ